MMLALLRSVIAVVIGYVVFAVSAFAVFRVSGQAAHGEIWSQIAALTLMAPSAVVGGLIRDRGRRHHG